jgi:hypothetical protein
MRLFKKRRFERDKRIAEQRLTTIAMLCRKNGKDYTDVYYREFFLFQMTYGDPEDRALLDPLTDDYLPFPKTIMEKVCVAAKEKIER